MLKFKNGVKINRVVKEKHHRKELHAFPDDAEPIATGCWIWFGVFNHMYGIFIPRFHPWKECPNYERCGKTCQGINVCYKNYYSEEKVHG